MLRDLSFANFRSYRNEQAFTMTRTKSAMKHESAGWPSPDVSCVAGVYGSNASGKTAFCEALPSLARFIKDGFLLDGSAKEAFRPFLLDKESKDEPTSFLVELTVKETNYRYEIDVANGSVIYESLRKYGEGTNRTRRVFERLRDEDGSYEYRYGKGRDFTGQKKIAEETARDDVAFLSVLHRTNCESVEDVYSFFKDQVVFLNAGRCETRFSHLAERLADDERYAEALSAIVSQADLGISVVELKNPLEELRSSNQEAFEQFASGMVGMTTPNMTPEERSKWKDEIQEILTRPGKSLQFTHRGADGCKVKFEPRDESQGTRSMVAFFSEALDLLSRQTVAFVDEIDTSLHPAYVEELVKLYRDPATNPHQSQLIFTTHDVSLITKSGADEPVIDQDQIWFTEKKTDGASELFPATSLRTRWEENFGRNYLHGVYGAMPQPDFHRAFALALQGEGE